VQQRHIVVIGVHTVAVRFEDCANASHAVGPELGGPQRAHRGRAEHRDAVFERQQDLLVPDSRSRFEQPVDECDRPRLQAADAKDVAAS